MKDRKVGEESQRTHTKYLENGFFDKYMSGNGLDIGYAGYIEGVQPILPTAIGVDLSYPNYDGVTLPFQNETQDYVYSSHCLEHIDNYERVIYDWFRVLKVGGYMITVVPHQFLYEKKLNLPSNWNGDHKRFYTPGLLMNQFETVLTPNSYRVRLLQDGDDDFDYNRGPELHSSGQYEIILVIQKIIPPIWKLS